MRVADLANHHPIQVGGVAMVVIELDAVAASLEGYCNRSLGNLMPIFSGEWELNRGAVVYAYKERPAAFEQIKDHHLVVSSFGGRDVVQNQVVTP